MMTNVMTNLTSRQRILAYLKLHNGASSTELSRALGVTPANARHHLSILVADGRVKLLGVRLGEMGGRPVKVYGQGNAALGDSLAGLAQALLSQLQAGRTANEQEEFLHALAMRVVPSHANEKGTHITRRLALTIERLNELGYASRWEAHAAAPRIIFERCPYAAVIARHPELCRMDRMILALQLDLSVEQTACLEKNARGTTFCQFAVGR